MMIPCLWRWCGGAQMMEMDVLMMIIDDVVLGDGFEPLHFMVEPMVQLMYLMIAWSFDDDDGGALLEMTWWCLGVMMLDLFDDEAHALDDGLGAMLELTRHTLMTWCTLMEMTYLDDMMTYMMEIAWWVSAIIWHDALACDEVSYTLSFTYPCASPTYSCNPLQDPHTSILNPNTPSYTLPCILLYPITLPIT